MDHGIFRVFRDNLTYRGITDKKINILVDYLISEPNSMLPEQIGNGEFSFNPYEFIDEICRRFHGEHGFVPLEDYQIKTIETIDNWYWNANILLNSDAKGIKIKSFDHSGIKNITPDSIVVAEFISYESIGHNTRPINIDCDNWILMQDLFPSLLKNNSYRLRLRSDLRSDPQS